LAFIRSKYYRFEAVCQYVLNFIIIVACGCEIPMGNRGIMLKDNSRYEKRQGRAREKKLV
jgi:hypothetical protein